VNETNKFNELLTFLYPSIFNDEEKVNRAIHLILANEDKSVIGWFPGKRKKKFDWNDVSKKLAKKLVGFTGRSYRDYEIAMVNQTSTLHWVAIDIDDYAINDENINKIKELTEENCSIRCSTGGNGLHLIFRLDKPYSFEPGIKTTKNIKNTLYPYVTKLEQAGVNVCCWQGGVFYLLGGKQEWLFKTDTTIELDLNDTNNPVVVTESSEIKLGVETPSLISEGLNSVGEEFFNLIGERVPIENTPIDIYVKKIYQKLKGTKFEFQTKSPMQTDSEHTNGFLFRSGNNIRLWTFADRASVIEFEAFKKNLE